MLRRETAEWVGDSFEVVVRCESTRQGEGEAVWSGETERTKVMYRVEARSGRRSWIVHKRFRDFFDLTVKLQRALNRIELPPSSKEIWTFVKDIWGSVGSKSFPLENRTVLLERLIRDLYSVQNIRSHPLFVEFLMEENAAE